MVIDHGTLHAMQEIAISRFKATCLAVLEDVRRTHKPVLVTRFGKPVAQIVPPPPPKPRKNWLGSMKGSMKIVGDIISPAVDESEWDALNS
jgi:prevent-host-death family protein